MTCLHTKPQQNLNFKLSKRNPQKLKQFFLKVWQLYFLDNVTIEPTELAIRDI